MTRLINGSLYERGDRLIIMVWQSKKRLTKHASNPGDSAAFPSIFLASSSLCSQTESTPACPHSGIPLGKNILGDDAANRWAVSS